jgi:subtilisin-like proprotein convertase family protein
VKRTLVAFLLSTLFVLSTQAWGINCSSTDITLSHQGSVDSFQANFGGGVICDTVTGTLKIDGGLINNLAPISDLVSIGRLEITNNSLLTNIDGLINLKSVGEDIFVVSNPTLTNIDGFANLIGWGRSFTISSNTALTNIDSLASQSNITGNLYISGNSSLTNIDGLSNLTRIDGNLSINGNSSLTNINGLINLSTVGGYLFIQNSTSLFDIDGLSNLTSVEGHLWIDDNAIINIDGLLNLTSVGYNLSIRRNNALSDIDGLASLESVGGSLSFYENSVLTNLDGLANLVSVTNSLDIRANPALTNLDGLIALKTVGRDLWVKDNYSLKNCAGLAFVLGWPNGPPDDNVGGNITITANNGGCNFVYQILDSVKPTNAPVITEVEAFDGQANLTFAPPTSQDQLWKITGYLAQCLADEQSVFEASSVIEIPDQGSVTSSITTFGVPSKNAEGLSISVNITHPRTRHLTLTLESPRGTFIKLWDEAVGSGENLVGTFPTTLDPAESLSAFDGEDFNGEWQLTVADGVATQTGTLNSWSMKVRDKVTATSATSPIILIGLVDSQSYSCNVSAITGLGIGPASDAVSVTPIPSLIYSNSFESE